MSFTVYVRENSHYMDPEAEYRDSTHATLEEAIARCQQIVDADLGSQPEGSAQVMLWYYRMFGDDPYIVGTSTAGTVPFSAWEYAERRAQELGSEGPPTEGPDPT